MLKTLTKIKSTNQCLLNLLILAFFFSGASALIYQVLWVKQLTLIFGSQTLAISTILASFMGGLSLGSYLLAKNSVKIKNVLTSYALIELFIALYALFLPIFFNFADDLYRLLWPLTGGSYIIIALLRLILSIFLLLIPTGLMGATLPLLVKHYVVHNSLIMKYTSVLYGFNTLGALIGTFLAGFYFLEYFGMKATNYIAITLNLTAGLIAVLIFLFSSDDKINKPIVERIVLKYSEYSLFEKVILWCLFFSGFTAMIYEVIWSRQLVLILGSTTYSYTGMLVIFLAGVSIGSLLSDRFFKNKKSFVLWFIAFQFLLGIVVIVGSFYYQHLIYLFYQLSKLLEPSLFVIKILLTSSMLILLPAILFGMIFPLSIKLITANYEEISEKTGMIYSFNTLGCICGSLLCGFVLIPLIGLKASLICAASLNIVLSAVIILYSVTRPYTKPVTISITFLIILTTFIYPASWEKQIITSGVFVNKYKNMPDNQTKFFDRLKKQEIVYYKEGQHSTIAVFKEVDSNGNNHYVLTNNGKIDASTYFKDMRNQVILGYLPLILKQKTDKVLIIGMGSGITAAVVDQFDIKEIKVVELEKAILQVARFFSKTYGNPLESKKIKFVMDDARDYMKVSNEKFDVIISEPSNVWTNGVANLFTEEYYRVIKQRLNKDGLLCQWIQLYDLKSEAIISVMKALKKEFKYVYLCHSKTADDFVFLASQEPLKLDMNLIEERLNTNQRIKNDFLTRFNISDQYEVLNLFLANDTALRRFIYLNRREIPVNSDDNSYLEFEAVKTYYLSGNKYIEDVTPLKAFRAFNGLNNTNFNKVDNNLYKEITMAIKRQLERSKKLFGSAELHEDDLYKEQILTYAKKYYREKPVTKEKQSFLARMFLLTGSIQQGIFYLEVTEKKGIKTLCTYKILVAYYGDLLYRKDPAYRPDKAIKYAEKLLQLEPQNLDACLLAGVSYYRQGNFSKSLNYVEKFYQFSGRKKVFSEPQTIKELLNECFID